VVLFLNSCPHKALIRYFPPYTVTWYSRKSFRPRILPYAFSRYRFSYITIFNITGFPGKKIFIPLQKKKIKIFLKNEYFYLDENEWLYLWAFKGLRLRLRLRKWCPSGRYTPSTKLLPPLVGLEILAILESFKSCSDPYSPFTNLPLNTLPLYQVANPDEERYRVAIDNDLNLEISGRTVSGEYQAGVEEVLSFGTREQLSFLFRLAIAAQLSRKEPAVMVLDDSFVNTDLHRLPLLLDLLMKRDAEMPFLVFTCRPGDYLSYLSRTEEKYLRKINLEEIMKSR
jgi:hypothetical protein